MSSISEIENIIIHYLKMSNEIEPARLVTALDRLSGHCYFLSDELASIKENYNQSIFNRKLKVVRSKADQIKSGESAAKAQIMADNDSTDQLEVELKNESLAVRLDLILRQANRVQDAMRTRISFLKVEKNSTKEQT